MDDTQTPPPSEEPTVTRDEIVDGCRIREGFMPDGTPFRSEFVLNQEVL